MAEKDLPIEMQEQEKKQELLEKIKNRENQIKQERGNDNISVKYYEKCEITLGGRTIEVAIEEVEEKRKKSNGNDEQTKDKENDYEGEELTKTYNIYISDVKIGEIDENGKFILNEQGIEQIDPRNIMGLRELGEEELPDISSINDLEALTSKDLEEELDLDVIEGQRDLEEIDFEEVEDEIEEEEKPEDEKLDDLMTIEAAKQGMSKDELKSNMIELELDKIKVTENKTLRQILGTECTRVFAVPRKRCK